jgi:hypothetical protein
LHNIRHYVNGEFRLKVRTSGAYKQINDVNELNEQ